MIVPFTPKPELGHPTQCMVCNSKLLSSGLMRNNKPYNIRLSCNTDDHNYVFDLRYDKHFIYFYKYKCAATITRTRTSIKLVSAFYNFTDFDSSSKEIFFSEKTMNIDEILEMVKNLNILI